MAALKTQGEKIDGDVVPCVVERVLKRGRLAGCAVVGDQMLQPDRGEVVVEFDAIH